MMNLGYTGLIVGWHVHMLFGAALFIGLVLMIIWAAKFANKKQLGAWTFWLVILGAIGILLTASVGAKGFGSMMNSYGLGYGSYSHMPYYMMYGDKGDLEEYDSYEDWQESMWDEMKERMGYDEEDEKSDK